MPQVTLGFRRLIDVDDLGNFKDRAFSEAVNSLAHRHQRVFHLSITDFDLLLLLLFFHVGSLAQQMRLQTSGALVDLGGLASDKLIVE